MKGKKCLALLTSVFAMASCFDYGIAASTVSSLSPSVSDGDSSLSVCTDESETHASAVSEFMKIDGWYVYVWRNQCGSARCYFDSHTFGDRGFEVTLGLPYRESKGVSYLSCTLDEMKEVLLSKTNVEHKPFICVFEIPFELEEDTTSKIESNPYPYICNDRSVYEQLGIGYCYEIASSLGYVERHAADSLDSIQNVSRAALEKFTPLKVGDYVIATSTKKNHIFRFNGDVMLSHDSRDFTFFNEDLKESVVGGSLENMIEKLGCPDYVNSADRLEVDYIHNYKVYRYTLERRGTLLYVRSFLECGYYASAIHDHLPDKKLPSSIVAELSLQTSVYRMIRKYGKPTARLKSSGVNLFAYHLADGGALCFPTFSGGLNFEKDNDLCVFSFFSLSESELSGYTYVID